MVEIIPIAKEKSACGICWCFGSFGLGTNAHFNAFDKIEFEEEEDAEVPIDIISLAD